VDWTANWSVDWTVERTRRTKCECASVNRSDDTMASIDGEVCANPLVIVISSTSDSEQSDPETQENVAVKL